MTPELRTFLEGLFKEHQGTFEELVRECRDQIEKLAGTEKQTTEAIKADLRDLAMKMNGNMYGDGGGGHRSLGARVSSHPEFKRFIEGGVSRKRSERIPVTTFFPEQKAALTGDGSAGALVVPGRVPGILLPGQERLTIRDLLRVIPTNSNAVQYVKETGSTNAAAIVFDPSQSPNGRRENVTKPESAMEFTLANAMVETIAHWIPASRQILDDVPAFEGYVNGRMRYMLKLQEEEELLNGDGTPGHLFGLRAQAGAFDATQIAAGDTAVDILGHAIAQAEDASDFEVDGIVLNNLDWASIRQTKNSGDGAYQFANPQGLVIPALWGKIVVPTKRMPRGRFLVGAFRMGADLWDRQDAQVEIAREHADFFTKNMLAILCEERLALTVTRPEAFVEGAL